jgi:hypothetical protein
MSYIGIPIKIATFNPETGEPTGNFETAVFATLRRCPSLGGLLKDVARAGINEDAAGRIAVLAQRAMLTAETAEDVAKAQEDAAAIAEAAEQATQTLAAAVHAFVVAGFVGAGYTPEQAQRYAEQIGTDRLPQLKTACLVGSGRLDFTQAPAV